MNPQYGSKHQFYAHALSGHHLCAPLNKISFRNVSHGLWRLEKKILRTSGNIGQRLTWGWWKGVKYVRSLQTCSPPNLWVQTEVRHLVKRLWKPNKYLELEITEEMWLKIWRKCDQISKSQISATDLPPSWGTFPGKNSPNLLPIHIQNIRICLLVLDVALWNF